MNRKSWTWHPEARLESQQLRERDPGIHALLAVKLEHLTAASSGRLGQPGMGRIRQLSIVTDVDSVASSSTTVRARRRILRREPTNWRVTDCPRCPHADGIPSGMMWYRS